MQVQCGAFNFPAGERGPLPQGNTRAAAQQGSSFAARDASGKAPPLGGSIEKPTAPRLSQAMQLKKLGMRWEVMAQFRRR